MGDVAHRVHDVIARNSKTEETVDGAPQKVRFRESAILTELHEVTCACPRWETRLPPCKGASDCYATIPAALSRYTRDCIPIRAPHVAFIALPFVHVTQRHADGNIKGLAVLILRDLA